MKYYIIESGEYSDYVTFIDVTKYSILTKKEVEFCLSINKWNTEIIAGEVNGDIQVWGRVPIRDIKDEIEFNINSLFACYPDRKYKIVLDKEYSKEELLEIVMKNDTSSKDYWENQIDEDYQHYKKALEIYRKITPNESTPQ